MSTFIDSLDRVTKKIMEMSVPEFNKFLDMQKNSDITNIITETRMLEMHLFEAKAFSNIDINDIDSLGFSETIELLDLEFIKMVDLGDEIINIQYNSLIEPGDISLICFRIESEKIKEDININIDDEFGWAA